MMDKERFLGEWYTVRKENPVWFTLPTIINPELFLTCPMNFYHSTSWGLGEMTRTTIYNVWPFNTALTVVNYIYKGFYLIDIPLLGAWFGNAYRVALGDMHQVIDTDYDNYAVVYSCTDGPFWLYHTNEAIVLSRTAWLESYYLKRAEEALAKVNYNSGFWWGDDMGKGCNQGVY
mmetsp:Transcript_3479/g.5920  ORF Transcript_3479/g.5920 Transcript_3479/m.5920 type:complete len:175 (-) Transcript_3479:85-609(-)|eukprot:CAMPEP_0168612916 /NCGR_PEP_ID=MMETSP0449_2-20121227/3171_1 /TAXON_ID=1082188 /ORGANISM="Strombidium rassoulzadegani, Strain ras09" /LENGTH=174 /DNA_ID=CAMNT_0008653511 /DNA_START=114 /DNA_END=638 /DNA_ORIENTATION=+